MNELITDLENAVSGLMMISESDYPFEPFQLSGRVIDDAFVLNFAGKAPGSRIEQTDVDHLFRNVVKTYPNSLPAEEERRRRFEQLITLIKGGLSDLKVYRLGEIQIDVFIIGYSADGHVVGLKTRLIET